MQARPHEGLNVLSRLKGIETKPAVNMLIGICELSLNVLSRLKGIETISPRGWDDLTSSRV